MISQTFRVIRSLNRERSSRLANSRAASGKPGQVPQPPVPSPPDAIPRIIPLEPPAGMNPADASPPQPRIIRLPTDNTGLTPERVCPFNSQGRDREN